MLSLLVRLLLGRRAESRYISFCHSDRPIGCQGDKERVVLVSDRPAIGFVGRCRDVDWFVGADVLYVAPLNLDSANQLCLKVNSFLSAFRISPVRRSPLLKPTR